MSFRSFRSAVAKPASTGTSVRAVSHRGELTVEDVWP
jgi:hypothetical protein